MSSFRNAAKTNQKTHRERSQLKSRQHLGLLEKKGDYKLRAIEQHKKDATIKSLKRKALNKNPDEFYFKMVRSRLEDGVHTEETPVPEYTDEQLRLLQTQDSNYVMYKLSTERKKIEKLKSHLHLLDAKNKPQNKHIVFVESKKEAGTFDAAQHLDTHPALLGRTYNRPTWAQLRAGDTLLNIDDRSLAEMTVERDKKYKELGRRIERERQLNLILLKMQSKRSLIDKKTRKTKVVEESPQTASQYKWTAKRKR
ncbi:hypothetical protein CAPTEDRAFT_186148 [Capitella teleta]|uniref:U3 small nucleolar RNA-associated protein 11 n=1 Tax=Capitella teleta TaxID=283909 RepID=R7UC76_CAPTE|nr:hypothetical protein CAPTEDRAFT_186148 [Capitella teleta]|eukprot:ELU03594.1 hypothetical protein CAPTEDRAFT_186148 [Capitella teleta]